MEQLAVLLEPHKEYIVNAASIVTFCHFLSGAVICNDIRKKKSTAGLSVMPFLAGFILTAMVARFGMILNDLPTVRINTIGVVLNIIYICFFYVYTKGVQEKTQVWAQLGYGVAFLVGIFAYTVVEDPKELPFRYGLALTGILFYFVGSPLLGLSEIIRKKSVEGLPFPIIVTGTAISFLWLLYGLANRENFVIIQNGVVFLMSIIQLALFAIYPSTTPKIKKINASKKASKINNEKKKD